MTNVKIQLNIFKLAIPGLFLLIYVFSTVSSKYVQNKILPMTPFKLRISGIGSDRCAKVKCFASVLSFFKNCPCVDSKC